MTALTTDTFFNGRIRVTQYRTGYRFSIDAVMLAYHARPRSGEKAIDLGAGCGIISLIMAYRRPDIQIYAVELQTQLAELARNNVRQNRMTDQIEVLCTDLKLLRPKMTGGSVGWVVCNPPYRKTRSGRLNPNSQRAIARHEIKTDLQDVLKTAHRMLRLAGRLLIIYPAERTTDVLSQMRATSLEPKAIRMIHSRADVAARLILVEGVRGGRPGLKIQPALILYDQQGNYTAEVQRMLHPDRKI